MSTGVVIYTRVSTAGQEDNFSLSTQEAACRQHAAGKGWVVVEVEYDVASGANRNRPGLERALAKSRDPLLERLRRQLQGSR